MSGRRLPILSDAALDTAAHTRTSPNYVRRSHYAVALASSAILCILSLHALSSYAPLNIPTGSHDELLQKPELTTSSVGEGASWNSVAAALGGFSTSFVHSPALNISWLARPAGFGTRIPEDVGLTGVIEGIEDYAAKEYHDVQDVQRDTRGCNVDARALMHANPAYSAFNATTPSNNHTLPVRRIALIQRGECSFVIKLLNAQALNFDAVIVYNDAQHAADAQRSPSPISHTVPSDEAELISMWSPLREAGRIQIPSVFVAHKSGNTIAELARLAKAEGNKLTIVLEPEEVPRLLFLDIVLVLFFLPTISTMVVIVISRVRHERRRRRMRAPKSLVDSLPTFRWSESLLDHDGDASMITVSAEKPRDTSLAEGGKQVSAQSKARFTSLSKQLARAVFWRSRSYFAADPTVIIDNSKEAALLSSRQTRALAHKIFSQRECAICLSDFVNDDDVRLLPCGHLFHQSEIDSWLIKQRRWCPVCRCSVDGTREDVESGPIQPNGNDVESGLGSRDAENGGGQPVHAHAQPIITREDIEAAEHYVPVASSSTSAYTERTPLIRSRES